MHQTSTDPAASSPGTQLVSLRWWADAIVVSGVATIGGIVALLRAEPVAVSVALFACAVVCGTYAQRSRLEYRRGWRQGYETATRVMLESRLGRTTDVHVRAAVHGDPTPEPWDEHVPLPTRERPR